MASSGENAAFDSPDTGQDWITPAQAATMLGVNSRYVYRLIDNGELESDGKKHGQRVTGASVEQARLKRLLPAISNVNFTGEMASAGELHQELTKRENNQMGAIALQGIQAERDNLLTMYNQAQVEWRDDIHRMEEERRNDAVESAIAIALLKERVKSLEQRLEATQEPPQAIELQIPAVGLETPGAPKQAGKRSSWWSRTFGGKR
jgi:hypothetical protein